MADFEALNELRSQTLRQIREMISEEGALWERSFDGQNTSGMLADLERSRARFRGLWVRHESIRQQMVEAGFMPPPVESEGRLELQLLRAIGRRQCFLAWDLNCGGSRRRESI